MCMRGMLTWQNLAPGDGAHVKRLEHKKAFGPIYEEASCETRVSLKDPYSS